MDNNEFINIVTNSIRELDDRINKTNNTIVKSFSYLYSEIKQQVNYTYINKQLDDNEEYKQLNNKIISINNKVTNLITTVNNIKSDLIEIKNEQESLKNNIIKCTYNNNNIVKKSKLTCLGDILYNIFNYNAIKQQKLELEKINKMKEEKKKQQELENNKKIIEEQKRQFSNTIYNILKR